MFQPASLKGISPVPVDERLRLKLIPLYITVIILSFIPFIIFEYTYIFFLWNPPSSLLFFLLLPMNAIISVYILQIGANIISSLLLILCKLIYKPKEGEFKRSIGDKNYRYWNIRNAIKKWPLYLNATNPLPWLKTRFTLRFFGVKIGKNTICDNAWLSSEFLEIGEEVIIGMAVSIFSFGIEQDKFILKKISIEDNAIIGAKSVILPGTTIKSNVKLAAHSSTDYEQMLRTNGLYMGNPAKLKDKKPHQ
jgi:acetyltransferase-like isoleucine patch superfamily enzyme